MSAVAAAKKRDSGSHPAVAAYRDKLRSIEEHDAPRLKKLNEELQAYLDDLAVTAPRPQPT
jgi:hypothetical protein